MKYERESGMLLHVTSLPSPGGVGTLGRAAYEFVDFLHDAGMTIWQMLPVGPTGYGDSPYQSASTFAGEPMMIDLPQLVADGLLPDATTDPGTPGTVDFDTVRREKTRLLHRAFNLSFAKVRAEVDAFDRANAWLSDYALYAALKEENGGRAWHEWPDRRLVFREPVALERARARLIDRVNYHRFTQYLFDRQFTGLKRYANERGVRLFGDMPIYVAEDSADTWTNPALFRLDRDLRPIEVAGVPPDYFSADGQKWGNPLYDWAYHKQTGFAWWVARVRAASRRFDLLRIDHFIGFANYYAIPAGAPNARVGRWLMGPGRALFKALRAQLPGYQIVAEDLGVVSTRVKRLRYFTGYPGMRVVVFGFAGEANQHNPARYVENAVAYTGTHDNDTALGWWLRIDETERAAARQTLGDVPDAEIPNAVVCAAFGSRARIAIAPLQDFLGLDNRARMNLPGTTGGNWRYRAQPGDCSPALAARIRALNTRYRRGENA